MNSGRYVTQDDWNKVQDALAAIQRVTDYMPEGHHRESIRNFIKPVQDTVKAVPAEEISADREHWRKICRPYGPVTERVEGKTTFDEILVEPWTMTVRVPRSPGQTEPDYKALAAALYNAAVALSLGIERGKRHARLDIQQALGIKCDGIHGGSPCADRECWKR